MESSSEDMCLAMIRIQVILSVSTLNDFSRLPHVFFKCYSNAEFLETFKIEMPITSTAFIYNHAATMIGSMFHVCNALEAMKDVNMHFSGRI